VRLDAFGDARIAVGSVRQRTVRDQIFKYTSNYGLIMFERENLRIIVMKDIFYERVII